MPPIQGDQKSRVTSGNVDELGYTYILAVPALVLTS